ncbi:unnamed protein product [marine sediment metagenome]|uniref:Uncharacterized protein n=1 Tax=marine sediment metagenome TaxID=412755 RepID=X0TDB7_9ZZZZ
MKCTLCKDDAICRDMVPLGKGNNIRYLGYCKRHRDLGLEFGFLEPEELESIYESPTRQNDKKG